MGVRHGDGGFRFPEIAKPSEDDLDACPESVRAYIRKLETRREDLSGVIRLLCEMDVFPDMLNRICKLVHRRTDEARAEESAKGRPVLAPAAEVRTDVRDCTTPGWSG